MGEHKKSILVVEDNMIAARIMKSLFESLGCLVDHVTDGTDAVQQVLENNYNAICMDIGLPTMSGVEACIAIRENENKKHLTHIPIIAVTGNNSPDEANEYINAGMQAVLDKPLTKEKAEQFLSYL